MKKILYSIIPIALAFVSYGYVYADATINNPLKNGSNIPCFITSIVNAAINILAVVAVLYIIYAGFLFVTARGNSGALEKAKTALFNALLGAAIILGAWVLVSVITKTVNSIAPSSNGSTTVSTGC